MPPNRSWRPGYRDDPDYWNAVVRYLGFLGVACLIASLFLGPGMIVVWILTAFALTRDDDYYYRGGPPRDTSCKPKKRRRC
jgi:hypothetical protein